MRIRFIGLMIVLVMGTGTPVAAQDGDEDRGGFGGPDAVENQIAEDATPKGSLTGRRWAARWFDWKTQLQERSGLSLGLDYSAAFREASSAPTDAETGASAGMVRFFGSWDLVGRGSGNTGALVWKVEHRHAYSDVSVKDLGFNLGYIGLFTPPFSDEGGRTTNLYYRQRLKGGRITIIGGFLDATDYLDVYVLASPWTGFTNFAFSTGTTAVFLPNDATLGLAAAGMLTDQIYAIGGFTNAYSDPRVPFKGFDRFVSDNEYFKSIEIGWTPSHDQIYFHNAHLTFWHVDESAKAGASKGWGVAGSYVRYLAKQFMPFIRGGYADDGGSLMQKSISLGLGYQPTSVRDLLGVAFNWGEPNESTWGSGLDNQYTTELFYRFQLSEQLAVTPDVQWLINPPNNPDESQIWAFGLRARLAL